MSARVDPLHVALITRGYPSRAAPHQATFVEVVARGLASSGARVSVIVPRAWGRDAGTRDPEIEASDHARGLSLVSPRHLSFSHKRLPGGLSTLRLSVWSFTRAVRRALTRLPTPPSILYGHFLYPSGFAAAHLGKALEIPSVVALGESVMESYEADLGRDRLRATLSMQGGILAVSEENKRYCVDRLGLTAQRITVIPNAVDLDTFRPRDRAAMRAKLGLPTDAKIIAFLGHFIDRKGPLRVNEILSRLPTVKGIFLGEGPQRPRGPQVLHAGRVPHAQVPEWLCASDLFVFPSRAEGSPNALLEAMACGLPVVASDIPAVREVAGSEQGVLCDPDDIDAMAAGVERILADESLRARLSAAALERAQSNSLERRVARIRAWLETVIATVESPARTD